MKKRWYLLMSVLALVVVLVSGCSVKNTESDKSALAGYPFTAGRYFWPKPEWVLPEPVFGEVPKGNPETLRPLTDSEKDRVVAIALSTPGSSRLA